MMKNRTAFNYYCFGRYFRRYWRSAIVSFFCSTARAEIIALLHSAAYRVRVRSKTNSFRTRQRIKPGNLICTLGETTRSVSVFTLIKKRWIEEFNDRDECHHISQRFPRVLSTGAILFTCTRILVVVQLRSKTTKCRLVRLFARFANFDGRRKKTLKIVYIILFEDSIWRTKFRHSFTCIEYQIMNRVFDNLLKL